MFNSLKILEVYKKIKVVLVFSYYEYLKTNCEQ